MWIDHNVMESSIGLSDPIGKHHLDPSGLPKDWMRKPAVSVKHDGTDGTVKITVCMSHLSVEKLYYYTKLVYYTLFLIIIIYFINTVFHVFGVVQVSSTG